MTTPTIKKLNLTVITAVAALIASCNSGSSSDQQPQNTNATTVAAKQLSSANNGITNMLTGFGKVGTTGYESTIPVLCFQNGQGQVTSPPLTYSNSYSGSQIAAYSGNQYYAGATIHAGGCDQNNNPYLGYIDFNLSPNGATTFKSYQNNSVLHMNFNNLTVDANGNLTGTPTYSPITSNLNDSTLKPTAVTRKLPYLGVNLSGLEFSTVINTATVPDLSQADAESQVKYSDLANMRQFVSAGLNTVRVPISWSFLALGGADDYTLNMAYWTNFVQPLLETLTSSGIYTILDLHTYMHYSWMGSQISGCNPSVSQCPDGKLDTNPNDYVGIWKNIYGQISSDSNINQQYLMLDIVNEPAAASGETLTPTQIYNAEIPVVNYLQAQHFPGKILIEGDGWSGLHSWTTTTYADGKTNAQVFSKANLQASGVDTSNLLINVHQYLDSDFSGTQNSCQNVAALSSTGVNGFNLQAFADYLKSNGLQAIVTEVGAATSAASSCQATLKGFIDYLNTNAASESAGFVGMTLWGAGHGWGSYNLYVDPTTYQFTTMMNEEIGQ